MARIKPDSDDDEFPDIAQLAQKARVKKTTRSRDVESVMAGKQETRKKENEKSKASTEELDSAGVKAVLPRPKKRVLNQKNDNPLLRPFSLASSTRKYRASRTPDLEAEVESSTSGRAKESKVRSGKEMDEVVCEQTVVRRGKETRILPPGFPKLFERKTVIEKETAVSVVKSNGHEPIVKAGGSKPLVKAMSSDARTQQDVILPKAKESKPMAKQKTALVLHSDTEQDNSDDAVKKVDHDSTLSEVRSSEPRTKQDTTLSGDKRSKQASSRSKQKPTTTLCSDTEQDESEVFYECNTKDETSSSKARSPELKPKRTVSTKPQPKSPARSKQKPLPIPLSDTEQDDSDDMSDFIVNDSTFLDDGESVIEIAPPRSVRRLVQGRRPRRISSSDEDSDRDLGLKMETLKLGDEKEPAPGRNMKDNLKSLGDLVDDFDSDDDVFAFKLPTKNILEKPRSETARPAKKTQAPAPPPAPPTEPASRPTTSGSEIENPFTLKFSPPRRPFSLPRETNTASASPTTPPLSPTKPQPRGLISPSKPRIKLAIPATPHRQSSDAFWAQDVINDWNDAYSPSKPLSPKAPSPTKSRSPTKSSFASKLADAGPKALKARKKRFEDIKNEVAERFLRDLDQAITGGKVGELARETGGVRVVWSKKLNTTAGRANWKRETIRSSVPVAGEKEARDRIEYRHHAHIELASKVIDSLPRLLNVLAHEYCHLANFMISGIKTNPHGKEFKVWAAKVTAWGKRLGVCEKRGSYGCGEDATGDAGEDEVFEVTTKHSYEIEYKYAWTCGSCYVVYKRHSKSIDPTRHRCGSCKGILNQTKPALKGAAAIAVSGSGQDESGKGREVGEGGEKKKELTAYQLFVKRNMARVKGEMVGSPQKDVMGEVGRRYREMKEKGGGESELGAVVRKLEFLDLTGDSP